MVTNFDPKWPSAEREQGLGWSDWKWPAMIHSWAERKWLSALRKWRTVPFETSSVTKSVNTQPTQQRPSFEANSSTSDRRGSGSKRTELRVDSCHFVIRPLENHRDFHSNISACQQYLRRFVNSGYYCLDSKRYIQVDVIPIYNRGVWQIVGTSSVILSHHTGRIEIQYAGVQWCASNEENARLDLDSPPLRYPRADTSASSQ